jgi:mannose-6-phosphate isomerase-like protein (cupin superfamily)
MLSTARSSVATHGTALTFETVREEDVAPLRLRPREETMLRVIAGELLVTADGETFVLGPGEEGLLAAGVAHRLACARGKARFLAGYR